MAVEPVWNEPCSVYWVEKYREIRFFYDRSRSPLRCFRGYIDEMIPLRTGNIRELTGKTLEVHEKPVFPGTSIPIEQAAKSRVVSG
jgi:hypothetical protein